MKTYELFQGEELKIAEKIQQRRLQILVHSYIYYECNKNIISDRQFDMWGKELVKLQKDYPEISKQVMYYEPFIGFDASTGFDLPYKDIDIVYKANRLLYKYNMKQDNVKQEKETRKKGRLF